MYCWSSFSLENCKPEHPHEVSRQGPIIGCCLYLGPMAWTRPQRALPFLGPGQDKLFLRLGRKRISGPAFLIHCRGRGPITQAQKPGPRPSKRALPLSETSRAGPQIVIGLTRSAFGARPGTRMSTGKASWGPFWTRKPGQDFPSGPFHF